MKLRNYKCNDLPKHVLPTRAWRHQLSHQLDKVSGGRRSDYLLNNPWTVLNLQLHPAIHIWGYFAEMCNKSHWNLQRIYRLTVCNRPAFALSMRCRLSRSRPRVLRVTITVISYIYFHCKKYATLNLRPMCTFRQKLKHILHIHYSIITICVEGDRISFMKC